MVLPVELFEKMLDRLEDDADLQAIREAKDEPVCDKKRQKIPYSCIPSKGSASIGVGRKKDLAERLGVKQSTIA